MKSSLSCIFLTLCLSLCAGVSHSQQPVERFQVSAKGKAVGQKVPAAQRVTFAQHFEKRLRARGGKAQVLTRGDSDKTLVIKMPSMNSSFARGIANNAGMVKDLRELGFKRMTLTDGKKFTCNVDLRN